MASYPTTPVVFPTRNDGQIIQAAHLNLLQDEIAAMENSLVGTSYLPTPQTIRGSLARVVLQQPGVTAKGYAQAGVVSQTAMSQNVVYNGTDAMRDDVTKAAGQLILAGSSTLFGAIPAGGSNPSTPAQTLPFVIPPGGGLRERSRATAIGDSIDVPFNAANFTALTGTWTVPQANCDYSYTLIGKLCFVNLLISNGTTSAVTSLLRVALPVPVAVPISAQGATYAAGWSASFFDLNASTITIYRNPDASGTFPIYSNINVAFHAVYGI